MVNLLTPLYQITGGILSSAQPRWDGGIVNFILNNVILVNSSEKASPQQHALDTIQSGGYFIALVCGLVWAILLLIVGLGLCICHCRRKSDSKTSMMYVMIAHQIQYKRARFGQSSLCKAFQFTLSILFIIVAFTMCILAFVVNAHLNSAMTSVRNEEAVIPSLARSVRNVHDYVKLLAPHARTASKPIVDEIVHKTEILQNDTRAIFTKAITKKMKGDILQENGIKLVEYMTAVYNSMNNITASQKILKSTLIKEHINSLRIFLNGVCKNLDAIKSKTPETQSLIDQCYTILYYLTPTADNKIVNFNVDDVEFNEATTLVTLLRKYNNTPEAMKVQMDASLKTKQDIEDKLYHKSQKVLKVSETIRNMTNVQWDDLEIQLEKASALFENVTDLLYGDARHQMAKYEGIRNAVYLIVLFILMFMCLTCSVIFIYNFSISGAFTRRLRNGCKVLLYVSMMILSIVVLVCTGTFLLGGYSQTEVCRYLEEKPIEDRNTSNLYLDKMVNNWLDDNWNFIEAIAGNDSSMPIPRPRDIFYGIQTVCRKNESIMTAINAFDSMDMSAMSKPEVTKRFLRLGRELMHESFRNTKPSDLLRPKMDEEMEQLLMLSEKFIVSDKYQTFIEILSKPVLSIDIAKLQNQIIKFGNDLDAKSEADNDLKGIFMYYKFGTRYLNQVVNDSKLYTKEVLNQKNAFVILQNHMNISNLVQPFFPAIKTLSSYLFNVTKLISEADELYDKIIVESTNQKSPQLMAESAEKIMGILGPCRHIFNAFNITIFTSCRVIVQSINLIWFFMGCSVFFLMPSIVIALLILTKEMSMPSSVCSVNVPQLRSEYDVNCEKYEMSVTGDDKVITKQ